MTLPVPGFGASIASVFDVSLLRLRRGKKLRLALLATALLVLAGVAVRHAAADVTAQDAFEGTLRRGFFGLLVYLVPFLFHSGSVAEEVESRTLPFLVARPTGRFALVLGKLLAAEVLTVAVLGLGVLVLFLGCYVTDLALLGEALPALGRGLGALALLSLVYGGICMFWGAVLPEGGGIVAILHLAIGELALSWAWRFRMISMNHHACELAGLPRTGFFTDEPEPVAAMVSIGLMVFYALFAIGLTGVVVRTSEYRFSAT